MFRVTYKNGDVQDIDATTFSHYTGEFITFDKETEEETVGAIMAGSWPNRYAKLERFRHTTFKFVMVIAKDSVLTVERLGDG
jgi:hypothetical protein